MPKQAQVAFVACVVCLFSTLPCFAVEQYAANVKTGWADTTATINAIETAQDGETRPLSSTVITLEDAIRWMLAENQQIKAQQHAVLATDLEGQQFSVCPNPELALQVEEFGGSGDYAGSDALQTTLSLSQLVELGGKRARRRQLAEQQRRVAEQQLVVVRSDLISETTERFVAVLVANKQLQLAQNQLDQAASVYSIVNEAVAAGKKAPIEALRFKSLATQAQIRFQTALTTLENSRLVLASSWHGTPDDFAEIDGNLPLLPQLPEWNAIEQQLERSPLLILHQQQYQLAQAEVALQKAERVKNLTVELGLKNDRSTDDIALLAGLSMPLALFDRNKSGVAAASRRASQAQAQGHAARQQQRQQVLTIYRSAKLIRQEIEALTSDLLPAAQSVFEAISYGYTQGKFGVIEVLDAQGRLLDSEDRYIEALTRYHQQFSKLDRLLGNQFTEDKG
jgi:cobalt-zinc-cadmium efflux system outer membrane protein